MPSTLPHSLRPRSYRHLPVFSLAVLGMGVLRFGLTVAGAGDPTSRFASMTVVIMVAIVYFGPRATTHIERAIVAYGLIVPYMVVESAGLGYTWWSGRDTIFHAEAYSLGTSIQVHFFGHIVGGLTWEPAITFGLLWLVRRAWRAGSD